MARISSESHQPKRYERSFIFGDWQIWIPHLCLNIFFHRSVRSLLKQLGATFSSFLHIPSFFWLFFPSEIGQVRRTKKTDAIFRGDSPKKSTHPKNKSPTKNVSHLAILKVRDLFGMVKIMGILAAPPKATPPKATPPQ